MLLFARSSEHKSESKSRLLQLDRRKANNARKVRFGDKMNATLSLALLVCCLTAVTVACVSTAVQFDCNITG